MGADIVPSHVLHTLTCERERERGLYTSSCLPCSLVDPHRRLKQERGRDGAHTCSLRAREASVHTLGGPIYIHISTFVRAAGAARAVLRARGGGRVLLSSLV